MSERICFSIVITAHNEGLLAHKTILSVLSAFEGLKEEGISTEIIIHIDNGDKETKDYFWAGSGHEFIIANRDWFICQII